MNRRLEQPGVEFQVLDEDAEDAALLLALAAARGGTQFPGAGRAAEECATDEGRLLLVAYVNRWPTGCGGYRPFAADPAGETVEITQMYVVPGSQRAGLARMILAELEGAAEEDGYRRVAVRIGGAQRAARALFEITGYRPWLAGSGPGASVVAKNLPPRGNPGDRLAVAADSKGGPATGAGRERVEAEMTVSAAELDQLAARREEVRREFLLPRGQRQASAGRGIHHTALICADVRRTVEFYQNVLGFPLTEVIENRDLPGSTHFFFDLGHGNALAFFDLPGVDPGAYAEVLGGLHHLAVSVTPESWRAARERLDAAGTEYLLESGTSIYLRDPDGARVELISDPLGEMYGQPVG